MSTVCKSALYYCRGFISINGRRTNYKLLIVSCVLSQSSCYTIWNKTVLCYTYMIVNKVKIDGKSYCLRLKESDLLKSKHQTQRLPLYLMQRWEKRPHRDRHFIWCKHGKLWWSRGLWVCRTLFVRQTCTYDWYKKRRVLQGWRIIEPRNGKIFSL